jgi:pyrimidine-specific ribonucleoside hydrolase
MKFFVAFLMAFSVSSACASAHPWKPSHYVIIDTDGGVDDMKSVAMLLASPDVRVLAITVSPGILGADKAYIKVRSLLNSFSHEGLPAGINRTGGIIPRNAPLPLNYIWGNEAGINPGDAPDHTALVNEILTVEKTKVSFICLGGMSTVSSCIRDVPAFREQVKEIIWSADGLKDTKGFNYNIDKRAAADILKGSVPVRIVRDFGEEDFYDQDLVTSIKNIRNRYADKISDFLSSAAAKDHSYSFRGTDEMIPVYLHFPQYFKTDSVGNKLEATPLEKKMIRTSALNIIAGETVARNQVIKNIPSDPSFYFADIEPYVTEIISKYGEDEWVSGVIANELHRHLGVLTIVGVKMGIRAREYFDTGVDEFRVTTFAGSEPPLSCMNDGIQVSTGATPGHGLLTVSSEGVRAPVAEFTYLNRKIRLSLKPEIAQKILGEMKEINFIYGLDSNIYWELVRRNSVKYWRSLDRHEIFDIETVR